MDKIFYLRRNICRQKISCMNMFFVAMNLSWPDKHIETKLINRTKWICYNILFHYHKYHSLHI